MGVNKVQRRLQIQEARRKYKEWEEDVDWKPLLEFFTLGLEAQIFRDGKTNKLLTKNDDLFGGKIIGNYQYTFRRQPLRKVQASQNDLILQQLKRQGLLK
jgi:hypothetical protein